MKIKIKNWGLNISSTFLHRARCKKCGGSPSYSLNRYFYVKNPNCNPSLRRQINLLNWVKAARKRMCHDYYLQINPSSIKGLSDLNYTVNYKGYKTRATRNKGINPFNDYMEYLSCECGKTIWSFYEKSSQNRLEVLNRKGKYNY
jgi:hypothetical protein